MGIPDIGSIDYVRYINTARVFREIFRRQPISRTDLAKAIGISKVTVSSCIDTLLKMGLILETGSLDTSRGRRPILIEVSSEAGLLLAAEANALCVRVLLTDFSGRLLEKEELPAAAGPEALVALLAEKLRDIQLRYAERKVMGVGIAVPGEYDTSTGTISFSATQQDWIGFPIRDRFQELFPDIPLCVERQSNCGAIAISSLAREEYDTLAYLSCSWGLGAGVFANDPVNHRLVNTASRFGHVTINLNGRMCTCGNRGCLESYVSLRALYSQLYPGQHPDFRLYRELQKRFAQGDEDVLRELTLLRKSLVIGIVNLINAYRPNLICLGGELCYFLSDHDVKDVWSEVCSLVPATFTENISLKLSPLFPNTVAYGCIAILQDKMIDFLWAM